MMSQLLLQADQAGIRLEMVRGLPLWEAMPVYKHQRAVDRIRATIQPTTVDGGCECIHVADVYISFPDGSFKRPDISVFCQEPDEQEEAITRIPEAVIEVISKGYEAKDLEIGPPFYLSQGVKDIVVFNPHTLFVLHVRPDGATRYISPVTLTLACGCVCTV